MKIPFAIACACVLSMPLAGQHKIWDYITYSPQHKGAVSPPTAKTVGSSKGAGSVGYSYEIGGVVVQILGLDPSNMPKSLTVPSGFVRIAPGVFEMGTADCANRSSLGNCENNDYRRRTITLTQEFYMLDHEVTQDEYKKVIGSNPSKNWLLGGSRPVEQVTWGEAVDYCRRRTQIEFSEGKIPKGYGYRLPTEAEWEYACTAGKWAPQYGVLDEIAWYAQGIFGSSSKVKGKKPNAWGLYDMLGNVDEWVADAYATYPLPVPYPERGDPKVYRNPDGSSNPDPYKTETDPKGPKDFPRVIRGGNFYSYARNVTTTARNLSVFASETTGFRVVLSRVPIPGNYR